MLSPKQQEKVDTFINHVKRDCKKNGVDLRLLTSSHVPYGDEGTSMSFVNGYFSDQPVELVVGTGKELEKWLPVLVHEYGHMQQWKESSPAWMDLELDDVSVYDVMDQWLAGNRELNPIERFQVFFKAQRLELDCEKRAIELIKKFDLPLNLLEYTQKANSYVLFYHIIDECKSWYKPGKEPYALESVWRHMPSTFDIDHSVLTDDQRVVLKRCFE